MKSLHLVHAGLLCALFALPLLIPLLRPWPLYLLAPLGAYALIVAVVPPLRRGVRWLRFGRLDGVVLAGTAGLIVVSSSALVLWFVLARPDVGDLVNQIPHIDVVPLVLLGAGFSVLNALMEEAAFRGVMQEALTAEWGPWWGIGLQGVLFGVIHAQGFPRGVEGMVMASAYGVALGLLRQRSGGLAASCAAHICADATIFALLVTRPTT
jgi:membrane protease YdiL (CAAX protease family)